MTAITEPVRLGDLLLVEVEGLTRDTPAFAASTDFPIGMVVAKVNDVIRPLAPAASDGTQIAFGVVGVPVASSTTPKDGMVIARNAAVEGSYLVWPSGITAAQKTTALSQLDARGIVARTAI